LERIIQLVIQHDKERFQSGEERFRHSVVVVFRHFGGELCNMRSCTSMYWSGVPKINEWMHIWMCKFLCDNLATTRFFRFVAEILRAFLVHFPSFWN
jgi:hypothetical protein